VKISVIDHLMVWLPIILIAIALVLACALRIVCRGAASSSPSAVADDPFFFPFGDMPTVPRERHLVARDFRAWGIPQRSNSAAVAHRRNESGGRPASLSGTAVVLTFPRMLKAREVEQIKAMRQHQLEEIARVFGGSVQRDV